MPHVNFTEPLRSEAETFVDCMRNGGSPSPVFLMPGRSCRFLSALSRSNAHATQCHERVSLRYRPFARPG